MFKDEVFPNRLLIKWENDCMNMEQMMIGCKSVFFSGPLGGTPKFEIPPLPNGQF